MRVVLLRDVAKLGRVGEVKEVADGYGQNFIVARGLGLPATPGNIAKAQEKIAGRLSQHQVSSAQAKVALDKLAGRELVLRAKANDAGHLFAAIHEQDIAKALQEQLGVSVAAGALVVAEPIKQLGNFTIKIKTPAGAGEFMLKVESGS